MKIRFKQLKEQENRKKPNKALPIEEGQGLASTSNSDDESEGESIDKVCCHHSYASFSLSTSVLVLCLLAFTQWQGEVLEETYASNESKKLPQYSSTTPKKGKRSKRKRVVQ
ncbi:hypothetical protein GW17_00004838 [Ensete ventricosum]|uniref:Uncharacterized protein n=1 Tax=Ensete ventricosum TaxID=4639 RepID=A0A444G6S7_ENSVE|nr:hypothetical protein GW17_00004838 [Ensete ventricosum]RZR70444.1 hypothetical protein BHM03_00000050 [Ensete ventricosum]